MDPIKSNFMINGSVGTFKAVGPDPKTIGSARVLPSLGLIFHLSLQVDSLKGNNVWEQVEHSALV